MYFFTADWHLGHDKVLGFMNRPFTGVLHMATVLDQRFREQVHGGAYEGAIDVGVDVWDFRPVPLTTIIERLGVKEDPYATI